MCAPKLISGIEFILNLPMNHHMQIGIDNVSQKFCRCTPVLKNSLARAVLISLDSEIQWLSCNASSVRMLIPYTSDVFMLKRVEMSGNILHNLSWIHQLRNASVNG